MCGGMQVLGHYVTRLVTAVYGLCRQAIQIMFPILQTGHWVDWQHPAAYSQRCVTLGVGIDGTAESPAMAVRWARWLGNHRGPFSGVLARGTARLDKRKCGTGHTRVEVGCTFRLRYNGEGAGRKGVGRSRRLGRGGVQGTSGASGAEAPWLRPRGTPKGPWAGHQEARTTLAVGALG